MWRHSMFQGIFGGRGEELLTRLGILAMRGIGAKHVPKSVSWGSSILKLTAQHTFGLGSLKRAKKRNHQWVRLGRSK